MCRYIILELDILIFFQVLGVLLLENDRLGISSIAG
jgi:hypothetical protein